MKANLGESDFTPALDVSRLFTPQTWYALPLVDLPMVLKVW